MISIEDFKKIVDYLFEWNSPTGFSKEWTRKEDQRIQNFLMKCNIDSVQLMFEYEAWVFIERNRVRRGSLPSITHLTGIRSAQRYFANDEMAARTRYFLQKDIYKKGWVCPIRPKEEEVFNKEYFQQMRGKNRKMGAFPRCREYLPYIFDAEDCKSCETCHICKKML